MRSYGEVMSKIGNKGERYEDMVEYKVVMEELMHKLEKHYPELYNNVMTSLEEIVYDIPLEKARKIVIGMRPFGEHWNYETVKSYAESKGIYKDCIKYYLVMNMVYNDYYDVAVNYGHQSDTDFFYELAHSFINDPDGKKFKVEKYFME